MPTRALDVVRHRARHEHGRLALERVLACCNRAGIDVLPVKGILTGALFYADPGERPIQDIDLRVRPADLEQVRRAARSAGWRLVSESRAFQTISFDILGFLVEFESHVGPPGLCALKIDDMIRGALLSTAPLGMPHLQPEIHDHALLLCVNAFKDKLVDAMPGAMRDLELIPDQPGFEDARFASLARDTGATTVVGVVAEWLISVRKSPSWSRLRAALGPSRRPIYEALFSLGARSAHVPRAALRVLARAGADRRREQLRALGFLGLRVIEDSCATFSKYSRHSGHQTFRPPQGAPGAPKARRKSLPRSSVKAVDEAT